MKEYSTYARIHNELQTPASIYLPNTGTTVVIPVGEDIVVCLDPRDLKILENLSDIIDVELVPDMPIKPEGGSTVEVTPLVQTGVPIAKIDVDGNEKTLYSPKYNSIAFLPALSDGVLSGTLVIDGVPYPVYCQEGGSSGGSDVEVSIVQSSGIHLCTITVNGRDYRVYSPNELDSAAFAPKVRSVMETYFSDLFDQCLTQKFSDPVFKAMIIDLGTPETDIDFDEWED